MAENVKLIAIEKIEKLKNELNYLIKNQNYPEYDRADLHKLSIPLFAKADIMINRLKNEGSVIPKVNNLNNNPKSTGK